MSRETLESHWGGHHRAHVSRLNALIAGTNMDGMRLEEIIIAAYNKGNPLPAFSHAAQVTQTLTYNSDCGDRCALLLEHCNASNLLVVLPLWVCNKIGNI